VLLFVIGGLTCGIVAMWLVSRCADRKGPGTSGVASHGRILLVRVYSLKAVRIDP